MPYLGFVRRCRLCSFREMCIYPESYLYLTKPFSRPLCKPSIFYICVWSFWSPSLSFSFNSRGSSSFALFSPLPHGADFNATSVDAFSTRRRHRVSYRTLLRQNSKELGNFLNAREKKMYQIVFSFLKVFPISSQVSMIDIAWDI